MELHEGETILFQGHPSWRSALLFFAKGVLVAVVVGAILWFAASPALAIVVGLVIVALTILLSLVLRAAIDYAITDERLHIRRGLIARRIQETRLGRVQNVTVSQTVFERLLQVGRADFDTAGDEKSNFVFAGIANPDQVRAAVDEAHRLAEAKNRGDASGAL